MTTKLKFALIFSCLAGLAPFAIDTYLPAFQQMGVYFNASQISLQQSLTLYLIPYTVMTLFHGAISDSIGRIPTLKWGLIVFAIASLGCSFADSIEGFYFFRILQGLSGGVGNVVARAMVRDLYRQKEAVQIMAIIQMCFGVAPAVAPIMGGLFLFIGWQAIFVFLSLYAIVGLWMTLRNLKETIDPLRRKNFSIKIVLQGYLTLLKDKRLCCLTLSSGMTFCAFFLYVLASPIFLITHLNLNQNQFSYLFIPTVSGMILGSFFSKKGIEKYTSQQLLIVAYAWMFFMSLFNILLNLFVAHSLWLIAPIALYNIGMGLAMPILQIISMDRYDHLRGTIASLLTFSSMFFSTIAAGVFVPIFSHSTLLLSFLMFSLISMAIIISGKEICKKSKQILKI